MAISASLIELIISNPESTAIQAQINSLNSTDQRAARKLLASNKRTKAAAKKSGESLAGVGKAAKGALGQLIAFKGGLKDKTQIV